ncbi:MAG: hypothetical protein V3W19_01020 [Desulfatiglandales bacterium]
MIPFSLTHKGDFSIVLPRRSNILSPHLTRVRAVGLSSHGMGALKAVAGVPEIDVVWVRINPAGLCMDRASLGGYDRLASVPWLKRLVKGFLPIRMSAALRPDPDVAPVSAVDLREVEETVRVLHSRGKGVVAMKVLAQGHLADRAAESISYVKNLPGIDSLVIGMESRDEIIQNCRCMSSPDIAAANRHGQPL